MKKKTKIIIGIVIGIILLGVSTALAEGLINSKDVIYQDNMSIGATDVQNAIDGTCSKIDTRLSAIEDKLYTIKEISGSKTFSTDINWIYTGAEIVFPANSYCSVTVRSGWANTNSTGVAFGTSSTISTSTLFSVSLGSATTLSTTYSSYFSKQETYYILEKHSVAGSTGVVYWYGFCATKV